MKPIKRPVIAITMGDPAGIGPEVVIKAIYQYKRLKDICIPVVIGDRKIVEDTKKALKLNLSLNLLDNANIPAMLKNWTDKDRVDRHMLINLIDIEDLGTKDIIQGKVCKDAGRLAVKAIEKGICLCLDRYADAIVTAPINKEAINMAGYKYSGHTELLAYLTKTPNVVMMLVGKAIRVALATTHIALKDVPSAISKERLVNTIKIINKDMYLLGITSPVIGVCALNPHAGEGRLFGDEEMLHIIPAIEECKKEAISIHGPFPADSIFTRDRIKELDVVLALYHDQGLIPIKMSSFNSAVNITLGSPIIRTSVDHGTAFDIAGKNVATPSSMIAAIKLAAVMAKNRFLR